MSGTDSMGYSRSIAPVSSKQVKSQPKTKLQKSKKDKKQKKSAASHKNRDDSFKVDEMV